MRHHRHADGGQWLPDLFEDTCQKFTQCQLKALGCQQDKAGRPGAPSATTFFRVLSRLDAAPFAAVVGAWRLEQEVPVLARLAVDGKVRRGSGRHDGQPLLRSLPALEGTLITAAALHCQQASARFITREVGGDYLFGLKGNQSGILERAERLLREPPFPPDDQVAREKGHGRLDRRRIKRVAVRPEQIGLCGCWQVIAVRREREELGRQARPPSDQIGYYATSLATGQLAAAARHCSRPFAATGTRLRTARTIGATSVSARMPAPSPSAARPKSWSRCATWPWAFTNWKRSARPPEPRASNRGVGG